MASTLYPITLGRTLRKRKDAEEASAPPEPSFVSVKYNFMPPSIVQSSSGYLHSPSKSDAQWMLEYDMRHTDDDRRGSRSSAQGFQGSQSAAKEYDCVLVWDETSKSYVLDRLSSTFSFKYDRGNSKLSEAAIQGLSSSVPVITQQSPEPLGSALGLELIENAQGEARLQDKEHEDQAMDNEDDDDDSFARQLELGLEGFTTDEPGRDSPMEDMDSPSPAAQPKTGLGITSRSALRDTIITPRGSPFIDRPQGRAEISKTASAQNKSVMSSQLASHTARSTPVVSPPSRLNSPRPFGLDSALPSSSSWKPPPQRSNVAIAYDEDDEEGDDESDDEEEDGEEDEEEDDDDFDSFARQLESSLQG